MWSVRSLASSYTSKHRLRVTSFSSIFHALFTTSKAFWDRSLSSWFLSGCTKIDRLRYRFFMSSTGVSGSICSTSNGFKLKYVDPGRNRRLICCSDVSTESLASICLTYSFWRMCVCARTSTPVVIRFRICFVSNRNWKTSNWFYLRIEILEFIRARWTTRRHSYSVSFHTFHANSKSVFTKSQRRRQQSNEWKHQFFFFWHSCI